MTDLFKKHKAVCEVENIFEWRKWMDKIPYIQWPSEWKVKAIPPFFTGIVRYFIQTPNCEHVSVYLDCYELAGCFGEPYWEVYPHEGDVYRCAMNDTDELLKAIDEARRGE